MKMDWKFGFASNHMNVETKNSTVWIWILMCVEIYQRNASLYMIIIFICRYNQNKSSGVPGITKACTDRIFDS